MANTNGPFGFRPVRMVGSSAERSTEYSIASGLNTSIFTGDPVKMTGTGTDITVALGGDTTTIGVFAGCRYINDQGQPTWARYWPANATYTNAVALVWDDPNTVFECQVDTLNAADVSLLADWNDGAGSTATGMSGRSLVGSAGATTGKSARILRLTPIPDNAYGAYAKAEVLLIEHALRGVVAGVGGV